MMRQECRFHGWFQKSHWLSREVRAPRKLESLKGIEPEGCWEGKQDTVTNLRSKVHQRCFVKPALRRGQICSQCGERSFDKCACIYGNRASVKTGIYITSKTALWPVSRRHLRVLLLCHAHSPGQKSTLFVQADLCYVRKGSHLKSHKISSPWRETGFSDSQIHPLLCKGPFLCACCCVQALPHP